MRNLNVELYLIERAAVLFPDEVITSASGRKVSAARRALGPSFAI
jgi:hypothetical protein